MDYYRSLDEYLTPENHKQQIDIWCRANNISREKLELFHDFLISLYVIINDTYLGVDVMFLENDQRDHFNWCWDKLITDFEKEKIHFKNRGEYYHYFWNFFLEAYYLDIIANSEPRVLSYFVELFNLKSIKTRSELDLLNEIYKLLNQNLKK
jgi:hypothetical protein